MSTRIQVQTARPYEVVIGHGVQNELRGLLDEQVQRVAILHPLVMRERARKLHAQLSSDSLNVHLIEVPDGESAKTVEVLAFCWDVLGNAGFTRSDIVVGLGGGATTDLAGFVAASWLRGVNFVTIPTTVLGMVDAAVGGKTGINTAAGKNLVGAFHEPLGVLCDLDTLASLPTVEILSGMSEVAKCGLIADPSILELIEAAPELVRDPSSSIVAELIAKGIQVKADTVAGDLRETGAGGGIGRELLNYGHTLGHAIERREGYRVRHGEAIAIGMVFAAELSYRSGYMAEEFLRRHRRIFKILDLPASYRADAWPDLLAAMQLDKKTRGNQLRFIVLDDVASPRLLAGPPETILRDSYAAISR